MKVILIETCFYDVYKRLESYLQWSTIVDNTIIIIANDDKSDNDDYDDDDDDGSSMRLITFWWTQDLDRSAVFVVSWFYKASWIDFDLVNGTKYVNFSNHSKSFEDLIEIEMHSLHKEVERIVWWFSRNYIFWQKSTFVSVFQLDFLNHSFISNKEGLYRL